MSNDELEYATDNEANLSDVGPEEIANLSNVLTNARKPRLQTARGRGNRGRGRGRGRGTGKEPAAPAAVSANLDGPSNESDSEESVDFLDVIDKLMKRMDTQDNRLRKIDDNITKLLTTFETMKEENAQLKTELQEKEKRIQDLERRLDKHDKKERANKLVITSPAISNIPDRNFKKGMVKLISDTLRLPPEKCRTFQYRKIGKPEGKKRALLTVPEKADRIAFFAAAREIKTAKFLRE